MDQTLKQFSDQELLRLSRTGDTRAFGEIVRRYESKVAATVIGMIGNGEEADDVGQEVFIRFYRSLPSFRGDSSIGTYITRIAINLSLNELKRRKRVSASHIRLGSLNHRTEPGTEQHFDQFDTNAVIQQAIDKLRPKLRSVVTLRMIEGYSTEETAAILHLPLGTVLSRLQRAQEKLRKYLYHYKEGSA